tara:strand:+ start:1230 stop:1835 length:606 start_codon:yes stop_codon:yes gene_type:complete
MSAVLSLSPEEEARQKRVAYNDLLGAEISVVGNSPVRYGVDSTQTTDQYPNGIPLNNENITFQGLVSPDELTILALENNPELLEMHLQQHPGGESSQEIKDRAKKIMEQRVNPYARAPVPYDMESRHPAYMEAKRNYERNVGEGYGYTRQYPGNRPEDVGQYGPMEPRDLEMRKRLASLGWDPDIDQYSNPLLTPEGGANP